MTHTPIHAFRLPLLAAATLALALALALGVASPAAAFVDDAAAGQPAEDAGFEAIGEGFVDSATTNSRADGHDADHDEAAPVGGVASGFGGMAAEEGSPGALHAVAAGLLALVALGLAAQRRRAPA